MYMPGRRRTGSRPSRTVMSFAVYVASAMKKALHFLGNGPGTSVSELAAGAPGCKARGGGPRDEVAELLILDRCRESARLRALARPWTRRRRGAPRSGFETRFRDLPGRESQPLRRAVSEPLHEARVDLTGELRQLERPRGRARRDVERPVAREAGGPCVTSDGVADRPRPRADDLLHPPGRPPEPPKHQPDVLADSLHQAARRARPGVTSTSASGSTGKAAALVAVTSAWPAPAMCAASRRRRSSSSSDSTSSRSSSGRTPCRSEMSCASASSNARTERRCSPCDP